MVVKGIMLSSDSLSIPENPRIPEADRKGIKDREWGISCKIYGRVDTLIPEVTWRWFREEVNLLTGH